MPLNSFKFAFVPLVVYIFSQAALAAGIEQGAIAHVSTMQITATGSRYEPLQNIAPDAQSKHVSDYRLTVTWSPAGKKAREEWSLNTIHPFPTELTFWAVYHEHEGERMGRDGFRPSTEGPIEPARIGAVFKDLWLSNPIILASYAEILSVTPIVNDGVEYERRQLLAIDTQWSLLVDRQTGLSAEISTLEIDPLEGEVTNRIVFSDWREVSGVPFPFRLEQYIDDRIIRREIRQSITVNPPDVEKALLLAAGLENKIDEGLRQWGWSMSNFFLRRMAMGAPADEDQSHAVEFSEVGEGIYQVLGNSHNNLIIEGPDGLAIVDAVWYPQRSESILRMLREKWPNKPLKYVILSHHHLDHAGGLLPYVQAGATVVTGQNNEAYFRRILNKAVAETAKLTTVQGQAILTGIGRNIELYEVLSTHAAGSLVVYSPDEKLLYNTDLYSPGRPAQQKLWAGELLESIEFYAIDVATHVGGHGTGTQTQTQFLDLIRSN